MAFKLTQKAHLDTSYKRSQLLCHKVETIVHPSGVALYSGTQKLAKFGSRITTGKSQRLRICL